MQFTGFHFGNTLISLVRENEAGVEAKVSDVRLQDIILLGTSKGLF